MIDLGLPPALVVGIILAATLALFVSGKWRHDVVAVLALVASVLFGVVKPADAFIGFADPAVVTVALVLILGSAIRQSGVFERILAVAKPLLQNPRLQVIVLTAIVATMSAFMNNIGALAIVMPIAIAAAEKSGRPASLVLMPLAFGSLLGGLVTQIGTPPNLLIANIRRDIVGAPFSMFDFAPVGAALAVAGVVYLAFAWRLLPADRRGTPTPEQRFRVSDLVAEVVVPEGSSAVGKTLAELVKAGDGAVEVVGVVAGNRVHPAPPLRWSMSAGDIVLVEADSAALKRLIERMSLELAGDRELSEEHLASGDIGTIEVVVTATSHMIGRTPRSMRLRDLGVNLLAMSRQGRRATSRLSDERFREGDVLALSGDLANLHFLVRQLNLLPLADRQVQLARRSAAWLPLVAMLLAVAAAVSGIVPIVIAFLVAVVVLALLRVMRPAEMYAAIDPSVIVLLAALIPVSTAVQTTGGTELISGLVARLVDGWPSIGALALFLIATIIVTPVLNNAATVLLMAPIAAGYAKVAGLNVDTFLMAVAIGASCDFLTPFGHQANTLVMGPGGYRFLDYARLGLPLSLIVIVLSLVLLPIVFPLQG